MLNANNKIVILYSLNDILPISNALKFTLVQSIFLKTLNNLTHTESVTHV